MAKHTSVIKASFSAAIRLHPKFGKITIGKYSVEPMPDPDPKHCPSSGKYLLVFEDQWTEDQMHSNPEEEAMLFLSYWSFLVGSKVNIESIMDNGLNFPPRARNAIYSEYSDFAVDNLPDFEAYHSQFFRFNDKFAAQFLRACEVYKEAVNLIGHNNTLSYFLLTVAIECVSNISESGGRRNKCKNFVSFIKRHAKDKFSLKNDDEWNAVLNEIYDRHRSKFTHGGETLPEASEVADRMKIPFIRNIRDDNEVLSAGLKWFEKVVRNVLLSFLISEEGKTDTPQDHFSMISKSAGRIKVRAKKPVKAGIPVVLGIEDLT
jgi:hypothetical protein